VQRYSIFSLARHALTGHANWTEAWRSPEFKPAYNLAHIFVQGNAERLWKLKPHSGNMIPRTIL
jgi:hypothetical protein